MKARWMVLALYPLVALAAGYALLRYLLCVVRAPEKALRIAVQMDEAANVALNGRTNQTISLRAAFAWRAGRPWGCVLCKLLDAVAPGHCAAQIEKAIHDGQ